MEIVLGVSMTPTTVRMVLVEGEKADGLTVDHDVFDITAIDGSATPSAQDQVIAAIVGTQESAVAGGHKLIAAGVTWSDHVEAAALRDALTARRIEDVRLFDELHAAGSVARAAGRAMGYGKTALMFIERDTATLSVVETVDGSIVKVLSRSLHSDDAMAVLSDMVANLDQQETQPEAMFVVGSGVDVSSVKAHLENLMSIPVSAPDDAELALARGAALAAANAPRFEASTIGLAYSQDPDGPTAGSSYVDPSAATQLGIATADEFDEPDPAPAEEGRKPFLLVGSSLTAIFVVGVVALVISLAVSIRPTVDQRPAPGESAVLPSTAAPAPPVVQHAQPAQAAPAPASPPQAPAPAPETIPAPIPVVREQPVQAPRTVYAQEPAAKAPAPAAVPAPAPAPAAPPPAPEPAAPAPVPDPLPAAPVPVYTPPAAPYYPPPVVQLPIPFLPRPAYRQPARDRWFPSQQAPSYPDYPSQQAPSYPDNPSGPSGGYGPGSGSSDPGSGGYSPSGPGHSGSRTPWWMP